MLLSCEPGIYGERSFFHSDLQHTELHSSRCTKLNVTIFHRWVKCACNRFPRRPTSAPTNEHSVIEVGELIISPKKHEVYNRNFNVEQNFSPIYIKKYKFSGDFN